MLQALQVQQEDLANKFQRNSFAAFDSYDQSEQENIKPNSNPPDQQVPANISNTIYDMSTKTDFTERVMLSTLQKMRSKMSELETKGNNGGRATSKGTSNNTSKRNSKTGKAWKRYFRTCGYCTH